MTNGRILHNPWIFGITLILVLLSHSISLGFEGDEYQIFVEPTHIAFSRDLTVNYTIPAHVSLPHAFIRLLAVTLSGTREITTVKIPMGVAKGRVTIRCGLIEHAGVHALEMHMFFGGRVLVTTQFQVLWPKFNLELPSNHVARTDVVVLRYLSQEAKCTPLLKRYEFQIELQYKKDIDGSQVQDFISAQTINAIPVLNISIPRESYTYNCNLFDVNGLFRSVLKNTFNDSEIIASSNVMEVRWSNNYPLSIFKGSIFPCRGHTAVLYLHSQCPGTTDKVRLYGLYKQAIGSPAAPLTSRYVAEETASELKTAVVFDCDVFSSQAVGYCFVYVTTSSNNEVTEQNKTCLPTNPGTVLPVDGGWNSWSSWGNCSVTCNTGKRSRFRYCNRPAPSSGGRFCIGSPIEWQPCFSLCPDAIPNTPLHSPKVDLLCACGCTLLEPEGEIIGTGRCTGLSKWIVHTSERKRVRLTFQYFDIYKERQWVKIRNGDDVHADLLAISYESKDKLTEVISTGSSLLIELMTRDDAEQHSYTPFSTPDQANKTPLPITSWQPTKPIHVYGFIATYTTFDRKSISRHVPHVPTSDAEHDGKFIRNTVTFVGISLCALIVSVFLAVVIYHRCLRRRHHKYKMATQTENSPQHIPKSCSLHSTPSHHSALSAPEIDFDMERPLTRQSKKSRASSVSSTQSNCKGVNTKSHRQNKIRFKTKADVEGSSSPKPKNKQYSPLPSPQVLATKSTTNDDKSGLFNTSPLAGRRSPKVHPSTRLKNHSSRKPPVTSPETKHDILLRHKKNKNDYKKAELLSVTHEGEEKKIPDSSQAFSPLSSGSITPTQKYFSSCNKYTPKEEQSLTSAHVPFTYDDVNKTPTGQIIMHDIQEIPLMEKSSDLEDIRKSGSGASDDSPIKTTETTSFIQSPEGDGHTLKPRRPTSLTESYSSNLLNDINSDSRIVNKDSTNDNLAIVDRQNVLPKPDGQSPKSVRGEKSVGPSPRSIRSNHSSRSRQTLSPSRSITSPSDNLEMEYDDFIDMDDTYSYFDPIETEKLQWKGAEKIPSLTEKKEVPSDQSD